MAGRVFVAWLDREHNSLGIAHRIKHNGAVIDDEANTAKSDNALLQIQHVA